MDYFSEESVLNLLYSYNPWWKTGIVQKEFDKPMKRASFFESKNNIKLSIQIYFIFILFQVYPGLFNFTSFV